MRIVYISLYPEAGVRHIKMSGVASYTKNLAQALPKNTNDTLIVLAQNTASAGTPERYDDGGIQVVRCFDRKTRFAGQIIRELKNLRPDVIHIQQELALYGGIATAILLRFLVKKANRLAPAVITLHGVVPQKSITRAFVRENNSRLPPILVRLAFRILFRPLPRNAAHTIVHEHAFKNALIKDYGADAKTISVIHHGIEELEALPKTEARRHLALPDNARVVLYMGYLTGYKGLDLLIDGFREYSARDPRALLVIGAGEHPKLANNPAYMREYNRIKTRAGMELGEKMLWPGFIEEGDIADWLSAADLSVFPYTISMSSSGPMALSLAYHLPFIASDAFAQVFNAADSFDTSVTADTFAAKRLLFPRRASSLADSIEDYFKHPADYRMLAEELRQKRLWKNIGLKSSALYTKLCDSGNRKQGKPIQNA